MKRLFLSTNRQQEIYSCADLSPENIDKLVNFEPQNGDIILIDGKNNPDHGIEMLLYFIFDARQKASIFEARFKIVLIGDRALEVYLRDYPESSPLFHIGVNYFYDKYKSKPEDLTDCIDNYTSFDFSLLEKNIDRGYIQISPPSISRHQLTNEWGAHKLAHTADLAYLLEEIESLSTEFKRPYFSFLKCKHKIYPTSELVEELNLPIDNASFLLIDDNHDKGWSLVFEHILARETTGGFRLEVLHDDFQNFRARDQEIIASIFSQIDSKKICGVLLDLRLNASEESEQKFEHTSIRDFSGGRILVAIKEKYPCLPVIIVTASNKVWNAEQLRQAGADGFFVKEDPTIFILPEVSKSNYEGFIKLVDSCYKSYEKLNPFWKHIKEIERDNIIAEKPLAGSTTKIKERIEERLYMFLGLIKRGGEDTKFNGRFHYSDIELAFITLWSCLIDIQFCYYDKTDCEPNASAVNRNPICDIKIHNNISTKLALTHNLILQERKNPGSGRKSFKTYINLDYNGGVSSVGTIADKDNSKNIGEQIAFLLLSFEFSPSVNDLTGNINNVQKMCVELVRLKAIRNELYLTHGDEESDFFTKTLRLGSQISLTDCKRLFEIVYFLLKVEIIDLGS